MKKSKIIVIFTPAISRNAGGISNTAYYLATEFAKNNEVIVFTSLKNNEVPEGITVIANNSNNTKKAITSNLKYLIMFCRKHRGDEIRIVSMTWRSAIVPWICKKLFDYKDIILCHGDELLSLPGRRNKFEGFLRKRILSNANVLCCNSKYTSGLATNIVKIGRIKIIHPCQGETICTNTRDDHFILSIGRLEERKGFQDVIEAVSIIKGTFPNVKYIIAGNGKYRDALQKKIELCHLQDNCTLLGAVSEEEKKELLRSCTMLVMPSFYDNAGSVEGFGIVFLEANAYGKPVIGSYSGGIPDAIINGKTGLLVHERNIPELVDSILDILNDNIQFDKNDCYEWAKNNNYENIAKQYLQLLYKL